MTDTERPSRYETCKNKLCKFPQINPETEKECPFCSTTVGEPYPPFERDWRNAKNAELQAQKEAARAEQKKKEEAARAEQKKKEEAARARKRRRAQHLITGIVVIAITIVVVFVSVRLRWEEAQTIQKIATATAYAENPPTIHDLSKQEVIRIPSPDIAISEPESVLGSLGGTWVGISAEGGGQQNFHIWQNGAVINSGSENLHAADRWSFWEISPNADWIAYRDVNSPDRRVIFQSIADWSRSVVGSLSDDSRGVFALAWSPDTRRLAYLVRSSGAVTLPTLYVADFERIGSQNSAGERVANASIVALDWKDNSILAYLVSATNEIRGNQDCNVTACLFWYDISERSSTQEPLEVFTEEYLRVHEMRYAPDGNRLAFVVEETNTNKWSVYLLQFGPQIEMYRLLDCAIQTPLIWLSDNWLVVSDPSQQTVVVDVDAKRRFAVADFQPFRFRLLDWSDQ